MARLSGSEAFGAGFRVVGRQPLAVLIWGLAAAVLAVAPMAVAYGLLWQDVVGAYLVVLRDIRSAADTPPPELLALQTKLAPVTFLQLPFSLLGSAMLYAAICRAVIRPGDRRFAYLRIGRSEWSLLLVQLVMGILVLTVICAALLVGVFTVMAVRAVSPAGSPAPAFFTVCMVFVGIVMGIWALLRLALALPMTVAEGRFRLFESWSLTRGYAGKMFLIFAGTMAMLIGVELLMLLAFVIVAGTAAGLGGLEQGALMAAERIARPPGEWLPALAPMLVVWLLVYALVIGVLQTLIVAPLADVYRQLTAAN